MDAFRHNLFLRSPCEGGPEPKSRARQCHCSNNCNNQNALNWHGPGAERCRTKGSACCASDLQGSTHRRRESTVPPSSCTRASARTVGDERPIVVLPSDVITLCLVSGLIEISTVERGVVSLYGVRSELFVAMNSRGRLYGTVGMDSISFIVQQRFVNGLLGTSALAARLCSGMGPLPRQPAGGLVVTRFEIHIL